MNYLNRYFVKVCGEYLALLNAQGTVGSTGSENGRMDGKKGTIDIIAQDSVRAEYRGNLQLVRAGTDR